MTRRDLTLLALSSAFLGVAAFRLLAPSAASTRQISVQGVEIRSGPIANGESLVAEATWAPPDDVFIVGWDPEVGAPDAQPQLFLVAGGTTIFAVPKVAPGRVGPVFLPAGTGFLARKGEAVTLRLKILNTGSEGQSGGARALIYFHPVAWR